MSTEHPPFVIHSRVISPEDVARLRAEALSRTSYTEAQLREMSSRHELSAREVSILTELDYLDFLSDNPLNAQLTALLAIAVKRGWNEAADWLVDRI
jgi:hypothetical protein